MPRQLLNRPHIVPCVHERTHERVPQSVRAQSALPEPALPLRENSTHSLDSPADRPGLGARDPVRDARGRDAGRGASGRGIARTRAREIDPRTPGPSDRGTGLRGICLHLLRACLTSRGSAALRAPVGRLRAAWVRSHVGRLWAIAITSAAVTSAVAVTFEINGVVIAASALGAALIAPLGLTTAGALWLAFLPPERYTRWIAARVG